MRIRRGIEAMLTDIENTLANIVMQDTDWIYTHQCIVLSPKRSSWARYMHDLSPYQQRHVAILVCRYVVERVCRLSPYDFFVQLNAQFAKQFRISALLPYVTDPLVGIGQWEYTQYQQYVLAIYPQLQPPPLIK
jgi:hypothetical protein